MMPKAILLFFPSSLSTRTGHWYTGDDSVEETIALVILKARKNWPG